MSTPERPPVARYRAVAPAHHPGPPRITAVGDELELAPRDPDPDATYRWSLLSTPAGSDLTIGDDPVIQFAPDAPGRYRLACEAPDGTHELTVHAAPVARREVELSATIEELREARDVEGGYDPGEPHYVTGPWNEWRVGELRAEPSDDGDSVGRPVSLPPGDHRYAVSPGGDLADAHFDEEAVDGPGRPRISLSAAVDDGVVSVTADPFAGEGDDEPGVVFELDDRDVLAREDVTINGDTLTVPTDSLTEPARIHAAAIGARPSLRATVQVDPAEAVEGADEPVISEPQTPPEWVHESTVYEIFVRSFAGETVDTTFETIEQRLLYLEELGVDCLWLTPLLESPTTHGYHITDYFDTADDLGTPEELASLVDACHDRGMRLVFDLVINHTSRDHPAFQSWSAGVEAYSDFYSDREYDDPSDIDWADGAPDYYFNWTRIPNVNYESPAVRSWMLDVGDRWAAEVDGFRCDVAWGVAPGFWEEVRDRVRAANGEFLMLDETVPRQADCTPGFGLHHDTDLYGDLLDIGAGDVPADAVFDTFERAIDDGYSPGATFMRYVENHDEDRYRPEHGDAAFRAAVGATFTFPGVPMIYYGQERGVEGYRAEMKWHDGNQRLTEFHQRLVACRQAEPALRTGDIERLDREVSGTDSDRVTAYARDNGEDRLVVLLNFARGEAVVDPAEPVEMTDLVTDDDVSADGGLRVDDMVVVRGER
ncbi:alpha-amylase family glycosyl hydrolase [Halolamina sp.]|uniref:alpha-amylase family glycosyl hydrolase n=1 Tax=Halolamina sp. TaxID=1940283 RepID=UPI0035644358